MIQSNQIVLESILSAIDDFVAGVVSVEGMQGKLQASLGLLERDSSGIAKLVRLAEADLEEVQFTMLLDDQRPAAIFRLDSLRDTILAELGEADD